MVRVLEKRLGALPVVAQFGRRLRIAEVVDELCPVRPVAPISHGEVIEALVANRLTAPAPLVQMEAWAAAMAVDEVYGIEPHLLNDDRLGRALDAIAPHLDEVIGSVGAAAISEFGVDVARLHWDMTSISLYGAYPEPDEEYPAPRWGHPKDRRPDLKQIQTGLAVAADGGIPVFRHAYDGGAGEVAQVTGAMTALKKIAGPRTFLLVGDSKLISWANAAAMAAGQAKARALTLAKAAAELDKLVRTAGTRFHPTDDAVAARVQAIAANRRAGKYPRTAITAGPAGKPVLAWHFDQAAIDAEAAADGSKRHRGGARSHRPESRCPSVHRRRTHRPPRQPAPPPLRHRPGPAAPAAATVPSRPPRAASRSISRLPQRILLQRPPLAMAGRESCRSGERLTGTGRPDAGACSCVARRRGVGCQLKR